MDHFHQKIRGKIYAALMALNLKVEKIHRKNLLKNKIKTLRVKLMKIKETLEVAMVQMK
jgi:hypothetical protein